MPTFGARVCSIHRHERVQRAETISQAGTAHSMHSAQAHAQAVQYNSTTVHIIGRNTLHPVGDEERKSAEPSIVWAHHPLSASRASKHYNVAITQPAAKPITAWNTADACRAYQGSRVSGGTRRIAARRRMRSAGGKASPRSHRRGTAR